MVRDQCYDEVQCLLSVGYIQTGKSGPNQHRSDIYKFHVTSASFWVEIQLISTLEGSVTHYEVDQMS